MPPNFFSLDAGQDVAARLLRDLLAVSGLLSRGRWKEAEKGQPTVPGSEVRRFAAVKSSRPATVV